MEGTELVGGKNLKELYELDGNRTSGKIKKFINKQPLWNPTHQVYSLNFHGKSGMASVKNTIIID